MAIAVVCCLKRWWYRQRQERQGRALSTAIAPECIRVSCGPRAATSSFIDEPEVRAAVGRTVSMERERQGAAAMGCTYLITVMAEYPKPTFSPLESTER